LKECLHIQIIVDRNNRIVLLLPRLDGVRFAFEYIANKVIRKKEEEKAKISIEKLLHNSGALPYEYAAALAKVERTMGSVPYLPALEHIYNVIVVAPKILIPVFKRTCE
jgi:hypothetical protein